MLGYPVEDSTYIPINSSSPSWYDNDNARAQSDLNDRVKRGDVKAVREMLKTLHKHGRRLDRVLNVVYESMAPLQVAAKFGHYDIMTILVDHGADMNVPDKIDHWTSSHYFARSCQLTI